MMKENKKLITITSLVTLAPILIGLLCWNQLPDRIATHFGPGNVADGWSSKPMAVIGLPVMLMVLHLFCVLVTLNDPKKKNIGNKMLKVVFWVIPITSLVVNAATYAIALGVKVNIELIVTALMGILFIVLGNYMSKNRQNYTVGIRIPWTLSSNENWDQTHRFASKLWIVGGLIVLMNIVLHQTWLVIAVVVVISLAPIGYSFVLYQKEKK